MIEKSDTQLESPNGMIQENVDRCYLRLSPKKDGPICVFSDLIRSMSINSTPQTEDGRLYKTVNGEKNENNFTTNCLNQDGNSTRMLFVTNTETLDTQSEVAQISECLQKYPFVLLTPLNTCNFRQYQMYFNKPFLNSESISDSVNIYTPPTDKGQLFENVTKDTQTVQMETISAVVSDVKYTNKTCLPTTTSIDNDQTLPLVIADVRGDAKDVFNEKNPIKYNYSENSNSFDSSLVGNNVVESFYTLLEAIESNKDTASSVYRNSSPTKMNSEGVVSLMGDDVTGPEDFVCDDIGDDGVFPDSSDAAALTSGNKRECVEEEKSTVTTSSASSNQKYNDDPSVSSNYNLLETNNQRYLKKRRKCQRVVSYSDDSLIDSLLDSMEKQNKKELKKHFKLVSPLMKKIRKKPKLCSKQQRKSDSSISCSQNSDVKSARNISTNGTSDSSTAGVTQQETVHSVKICLYGQKSELKRVRGQRKNKFDKTILESVNTSVRDVKPQRKSTTKKSQMSSVFAKLEKELGVGSYAASSITVNQQVKEEDTTAVKMESKSSSYFQETKPETSSFGLSKPTKAKVSPGSVSEPVQRPLQSYPNEEKPRKRRKLSFPFPSSLDSDNNHDLQCGSSKRTKQPQNDNEAPLKRLARELPGFNWLEDKIKNISQSVQVPRTETLKDTRNVGPGHMMDSNTSNHWDEETDHEVAKNHNRNTERLEQSEPSLVTSTEKGKSEDVHNRSEWVENEDESKGKNSRFTFYEEVPVTMGTSLGQEITVSPSHHPLKELSTQPMSSKDQHGLKPEKTEIPPSSFFYCHPQSSVLEAQQKFSVATIMETNKPSTLIEANNVRRNSSGESPVTSSLEEHHQYTDLAVSRSTFSKFLSTCPKMDPSLISKNSSLTLPSLAEKRCYTTELSSKEYRDLESAGKPITVTSAHEPTVERKYNVHIGNEKLYEFASKTSAFRKVQDYKMKNLNSSALNLQVSNPSTKGFDDTQANTCDRSNCFSNKFALNCLKPDEGCENVTDLSLEQLKEPAKLNSHLNLDMPSLKEHNEMSLTDLEPLKRRFCSVSSSPKEHNTSHLIKPSKFNAPTMNLEGALSTQCVNSYTEQNIMFQPTNASRLLKTPPSDCQKKPFYKECTPVTSQGDQWTSQQYTKHLDESVASFIKDISLPEKQEGSYSKPQLMKSSNIRSKEAPIFNQLSQGSADESQRSVEYNTAKLILKTKGTEDTTLTMPNKVTELKSQSTQTSDETVVINNTSSTRFKGGGGMVHCSDELTSKANLFRIPLRQKNCKSLDNYNYHSSKNNFGCTEHGLYKPHASRLENDSLSLSNSAGYLSLKRKRLMSYAIDKEKEVTTKHLSKQGEKDRNFENTGNEVTAQKTVSGTSAETRFDTEGIANTSKENEIQVIYESEQSLKSKENSKSNVLSSSVGFHEEPSHVVSSGNDKNVHNQQKEDFTNTDTAHHMTEEEKREKREKPARRRTSSMPPVTYVESSSTSLSNFGVLTKGATSSSLTSIDTGVVPKGTVSSGLTSVSSGVVPKETVSSGLTLINNGVMPGRATLSGLHSCTQSYETLDKNDNQSDYSLIKEKSRPFRNLTEEMENRKKELVILDQLAKQREKEYRELLETRKEKYRLLDMLEKCFPKLVDSPEIEDDEKKPFKSENINAETISMSTNYKFELNASFKSDQPVTETKPTTFNLDEGSSAQVENDAYNTGGTLAKVYVSSGSACRDSEKKVSMIGNQETHSDKSISNIPKLSGPVWKSESKPSHCHTIPTAAVNPLKSLPAPLIQTYPSGFSSLQFVPPLNKSIKATGVIQYSDKSDQTPEKQNPKNAVEKKMISPSVATVAPVMNNSCQPGEVCCDKQSCASNVHLRTLYDGHLSSVANSSPSLQKFHNCAREHKNDHCDVCERIIGCSVPKPNSNTCFTRDIVQKQSGCLPQERANEFKNSQNKTTAFYTVRPNALSHQTLINPLAMPSLSGYSGTSEPKYPFKHDNLLQVRSSPEALHRLPNPNFTTPIKNFASQVPSSHWPEAATINCKLPDLSSQPFFRRLVDPTHYRVEVRPIIEQQPYQVVQQRGNVSRSINSQTLSTVASPYDTWTQRPVMLNYPPPQSMVRLPSDHHLGNQAKHWPNHSKYCRN
ncbi:uncharacterized protein LOC143244189 isoform X2 [Tachypleus tridentatus]|uniref:uncharacterized protein LOC143244189 isoform X2 n=1 Tax=Tachypleus tridentatus TaxID=6853 RepID=UPI003FD229C0